MKICGNQSHNNPIPQPVQGKRAGGPAHSAAPLTALLGPASRLFTDSYLYRHHCFVPRAGVSEGAQHYSFVEADLAELLKESTAFLCASHSSKPILYGRLYLFRRGSRQNELRCIDAASWFNNPGKLAEYLGPFEVEVENPIGQRHIDRVIF